MRAVQGTPLQQTLSDPTFTGIIFVPIDVKQLQENFTKTGHSDIAEYHVVPGNALNSAELSNATELQTLLNTENAQVNHCYLLKVYIVYLDPAGNSISRHQRADPKLGGKDIHFK